MVTTTNFTTRARQVLRLAEREAKRFNHEYVGTEHLLLALVAEGWGLAIQVLRNLNLDLATIRSQVESIIQPGTDKITGPPVQTPRVQRVLDHALEETRSLRHPLVGTEHLLLGLLREQEGVAEQILVNLGLSLAQVREEILCLMSGPSPDDHPESGRRPLPESEEDLPAETQIWPASVRAALGELDAQIEQLRMEKEAAIAEQDFERAAHLREQAAKLDRQKRTIVQTWRSRIRVLTALGGSESPAVKAVALTVLAGDWSALPILADALEDAGDLRAHVVRAWTVEMGR
jgi:ATP-dependent Clp protease ATP-binding subunit ClpA